MANSSYILEKVILVSHDVYICHSKKDKATADAICHVLEENKIKCWIKPRDLGIKQDTEEIMEAISNSKVFILVFSKNAMDSNFVDAEVNMAFRLNIPIVTFKIDSTRPYVSFSDALENTHWLDAYPNPTKKFENLIIDTSKLLGNPISKPVISPNLLKISSSFTDIDFAEESGNEYKNIILVCIAIFPLLVLFIVFFATINMDFDFAFSLIISIIFITIAIWFVELAYVLYEYFS